VPELKSLMTRVEEVRQLWTVATRGVPLPDDDKLMYWCGRFSETEIEHAMMRLSAKLHKTDVMRSTEQCIRYASGVLKHEAEKTKVKLARVLARINAVTRQEKVQ
jgi:hypothetical protein